MIETADLGQGLGRDLNIAGGENEFVVLAGHGAVPNQRPQHTCFTPPRPPPPLPPGNRTDDQKRLPPRRYRLRQQRIGRFV